MQVRQICAAEKYKYRRERERSGRGVSHRCPACTRAFYKEAEFKLHYAIAHNPPTERVAKNWSAPWMKPQGATR